MTKKIIFSSGGTGGHIFPAINLMKYFSNKGNKVLLVTDTRGKNFLKQYSKFKSYIVRADSPINKNFFRKILSFSIIFSSIIRSIFILMKEKPHLIFGMLINKIPVLPCMFIYYRESIFNRVTDLTHFGIDYVPKGHSVVLFEVHCDHQSDIWLNSQKYEFT